jgi:HEAT repeat protein
MSKKATVSILVALVVLSIVSLIAFKKGYIPRWSSPKSKVLTESERLAELRKKDLATLSSSTSLEGDVYAALVRLAQTHDPIARQEAVKRNKNESILIRKGVAQALGSFDDEESVEILVRMMNDSNSSVREAAIEGLGKRTGGNRQKILQEMLKKTRSRVEKFLILSSLVNLAPSQDAKEFIIKQIVDMIGTESNESLATRASFTVMGLNPRSPNVIGLVVRVLKANRPLQLVPQAIRHLGAIGHPWLKENLDKLMTYPEPSTRQAAIQVLHFVCPSNRWSILEQVMSSERDRSVADAALRETVMMPGPEARAFLERQIASDKIIANEKQLAETLLAQVRSTTAVDPCLK